MSRGRRIFGIAEQGWQGDATSGRGQASGHQNAGPPSTGLRAYSDSGVAPEATAMAPSVQTAHPCSSLDASLDGVHRG